MHFIGCLYISVTYCTLDMHIMVNINILNYNLVLRQLLELYHWQIKMVMVYILYTIVGVCNSNVNI